jgi:hypothetical protein
MNVFIICLIIFIIIIFLLQYIKLGGNIVAPYPHISYINKVLKGTTDKKYVIANKCKAMNNIITTDDEYFIICKNDCNKILSVKSYRAAQCIVGSNRILNCTNLHNFNIAEYKRYIMLKEFVYKLYKYIKNVNKIPNIEILSYRNEFKDAIKYYDKNEYEFIFDYNTKDEYNTMFKLLYIENGMITRYIEPMRANKLDKSNNICIKEFLKEKFPKFITF